MNQSLEQSNLRHVHGNENSSLPYKQDNDVDDDLLESLVTQLVSKQREIKRLESLVYYLLAHNNSNPMTKSQLSLSAIERGMYEQRILDLTLERDAAYDQIKRYDVIQSEYGPRNIVNDDRCDVAIASRVVPFIVNVRECIVQLFSQLTDAITSNQQLTLRHETVQNDVNVRAALKIQRWWRQWSQLQNERDASFDRKTILALQTFNDEVDRQQKQEEPMNEKHVRNQNESVDVVDDRKRKRSGEVRMKDVGAFVQVIQNSHQHRRVSTEANLQWFRRRSRRNSIRRLQHCYRLDDDNAIRDAALDPLNLISARHDNNNNDDDDDDFTINDGESSPQSSYSPQTNDTIAMATSMPLMDRRSTLNFFRMRHFDSRKLRLTTTNDDDVLIYSSSTSSPTTTATTTKKVMNVPILKAHPQMPTPPFILPPRDRNVNQKLGVDYDSLDSSADSIDRQDDLHDAVDDDNCELDRDQCTRMHIRSQSEVKYRSSSLSPTRHLCGLEVLRRANATPQSHNT